MADPKRKHPKNKGGFMAKGKREPVERGIYKLGKFYIAEWHDQYGKRHRKQCTTVGRARRYKYERELEKWDGSFDPASVRRGKNNILFDELAKDRLEDIKLLASYEGEAGKINWWNKRFKNCLVRSITYQDINKALVDKAGSVKPSTRNLYFATVRSIFRLAAKNNKIERNPCQGIKKLKASNKIIRWLDIGEERKLMAVMPEEFQLIVRVAINTGLRVSEQMSLRWDDIDLRNRQITLRETKSGETQFQPMNSIAFEAFRRLKLMPTHISGEVFHWINQFKGYKKTRSYYNLNYYWKSYCKMAGIKKCRWHDLRHSFASRMVIDGENIVQVQKLMRHADITTTMRYIHLAPKNQQEALSRLSKWYDKADNWQEIDTEQPSVRTVNY